MKINSEDEFSDLSQAFNQMLDDLKLSRDQLERQIDITAYANAELKREVLEKKNAEARLREASHELERSNAELRQLANVAAHDLQEPLRAVVSFTQLLWKRYRDRLDQQAEEFMNYAVDGARNMRQLLQDIQAYLVVGQEQMSLTTTNTDTIFDITLERLSETIEENNVVITREPLPTVDADPMQIGVVFQQLLGNAIKFRSEEDPKIHIRAEEQEHHWIFSLRDNGIGFDSQYLDKIFIIFEQLFAHKEYAGTGLGLALCKKIIEQHGGSIWAESKLGEGAIFYFTLPKANS